VAHRDKLLENLVSRLKADVGENLRSVVLYGSAASGEFHAKHSDLNVLCLLHRVNPSELSKLHKAAAWFVRKRNPMPLALSLDELRAAADIYAIELLEIKTHRQVLYGEDVFGTIDVPMSFHRTQVERELRHELIRLRQGYIAAVGDRKAIWTLMTRSASSFALLFRHTLIALGENPSSSREDAVHRLAALLGFDAASFKPLFEVRDGSRKEKELSYQQVFDKYFRSVAEAVNAIDQKFAELK
jgi:predicted nucleotidyltransferase